MRKLDDEYNESSNTEKREFCCRYNISDLFFDDYNYDDCFLPPLEGDENVPPMPPLVGDEQEKEEKGIKLLTSNKLLTRLPVLLAQIKAGNNSYKLENEIIEILYLLYYHNKITKTIYNNLIKSLQ